MHNFANKLKSGYYRAGVAVAGSSAALVVPGSAHAAAQDYSDLGDAASAEITAAVPVGLLILGIAFGIPLAIRVIRRLTSG